MSLPGSYLSLENAEIAAEDFDWLGAGDFIAQIRQPEGGISADLDMTIEKLGGRVSYAELHTDNGYLTRVKPLVISINERDSLCVQTSTKAHELGHFFLRTACPYMKASWGSADMFCPDGTPGHAAIEAFCDYFAHRLIGVPECLVGAGETA